jgi:hypothetical protein
MRNLRKLTGWLILLPAFSLLGATPSLNEVLMRVSRNVQDFRDLLPDFVCSERITSTRYEANGQIATQRVVDSTFTGLQKNDGKGLSYIESRDVQAIDGNSGAKGQPMPALPFKYGGGFSSAVVSTFTPEVMDSRTFRMAGSEVVGGTPSLILEYATKKGQTKLFFETAGKKVIVKDSGKAWIDPQTMQVLRLERHFINFPNFNQFSTYIDYGATEIGGKVFWMPKIVRADAFAGKSQNKISYVAEYSNCRRYVATVEIRTAE